MQVIKSKFNSVGWWGLTFLIVPLPVVALAYKLVEDSNRSLLSIWQTTQEMDAMGIVGRSEPRFPSLSSVSPWVLVLAGAFMLLGLVMMIIGRDSYVLEVSK